MGQAICKVGVKNLIQAAVLLAAANIIELFMDDLEENEGLVASYIEMANQYGGLESSLW